MADSGVEVRPTPAQLESYFRRLMLLSGADRARTHAAIAIQLRTWVMRNFESQGAPHGNWAPLRPRTVADRKRKGYWPGKILQRSGWLKQSFKEFWDSDEAGVGSEVEYSKYHEEGYSIYGHPVPARPMLPTQELVRDDVFRVYQFWLTRFERAGKI